MVCTRAIKNIRKDVRGDEHCIVNTVLTHNCRKNVCQVYLLLLDIPNLLTYLLTYLFTYLLTHLLTYLLTYLLSPRNRVLLENVTGFQLVQKFSTFYGTRSFITAFTCGRQLSLYQARAIQSMSSHPTSWRSILILPYHLRQGLPSGLFLSGLPTKILYTRVLAHIRATCPIHLILLDFITRTIFCEEHRSLSSSLCSFLRSPVTSPHLGPIILLNTLFSNTLNLRSSLSVSDQVSHSYKTTGKIIVLYILIFIFQESKL